MGRKALTTQTVDKEERGPAGCGVTSSRRRRLIPACQGDRAYVRAVEQLIADAARARSFGARGFGFCDRAEP